MDTQIQAMPPHQHAFIERFVDACQHDARVLAAFLGGSYAKGTADAHSDLDLSLISTDTDYAQLSAGRAQFLGQLGELVFLESFNVPQLAFFIYADGTEGELWFGSQGQLEHIQPGPYRVLLDKPGLLANTEFPAPTPAQAEQVETLRRRIAWFWHDMSHFTTAMARGQLWWAHGQIDILRCYCVDLARLQHNFAAEAEGYEKVEQALPLAQLAPLEATYCPLERSAMLEAAHLIVRFYQQLAPPLARAHGIAYPAALERVMLGRLEQVEATV